MNAILFHRFEILLIALALAQSAVAEEKTDSYHAQLLALHNTARAQQKAAPLTHDALLAKAAQAHAEHMAKTGQFAHDEIGDGTIQSRIDDAGYDWSRAGENIAWSGKDSEDDSSAVMNIWLKSAPHKKLLLSDYRQVGFGRATAAGGKVYWVACFGVPSS